MSNYEETAKAYENDYRFAPVGMAVGSFWGGALCAGLVAFVMSCGIAKGFFTSTIKSDHRVLFADDTKGLYLGIAIAVTLLIASILCGVVGYGATLKKRDLKGLWTLSLIGVPALTTIGTVIGIVVAH